MSERLPLHEIEAQIMALTMSLERLEEQPPRLYHRDTHGELRKRLRRWRGSWKLYRDGVIDWQPELVHQPRIVHVGPCPDTAAEEMAPCLTPTAATAAPARTPDPQPVLTTTATSLADA